MKRIQGISNIDETMHSSVVTIGNFDGLHLGHQALIKKTAELALKYKAKSIVMSFKPHPVKILFPEKDIKKLFSFVDQEEQLDLLGIEFFVQQPFSRKLSDLSAERFLTDLILKPLNPKALVVGYDFAFGANREGSIGFLESFCEKNSIELFVQSPIKVDDDIVSSSLIRNLVAQGNFKFVSKCLGRHFYLEGVVERGAGRGRQIGFPTANVFTTSETFPRLGVYASVTSVRGVAYRSITNVGKNPTFEAETKRPIQVETHILGFDDDIYGDNIKVEFVDFIRTEKKFTSVEELVQRISIDVSKAREVHDQMGISK